MTESILTTRIGRIVLGTAIAALSLSSVAVVGASGASIDETGPDSTNKVEFDNDFRTRIRNTNNANATNNNPQDADSGDASVKHNTTGGSAETGEASNDSTLDVQYSVDNSGSGWAYDWGELGGDTGDISNTGPDSYNKIEVDNDYSVRVTNTNNLTVTNNNSQHADSGNARVWGNTTGGDATSGDATNTSNTSINMDVTN